MLSDVVVVAESIVLGAHCMADRGPGRSFGTLLRDFRRQAGLSQTALATRAGLATSAISALERGVRQRPHPQTIDLLSAALALRADERASLVSASWSPRPDAPHDPGQQPS